MDGCPSHDLIEQTCSTCSGMRKSSSQWMYGADDPTDVSGTSLFHLRCFAAEKEMQEITSGDKCNWSRPGSR
jgi:hypothetical protein